MNSDRSQDLIAVSAATLNEGRTSVRLNMKTNSKKKKSGETRQKQQYDYSILDRRRLPASLTAEQVAVLLHCTKDEIPVLVREGFLDPLGDPINNSVKHFHTATLEKKMADEEFCYDMRAALYGKNRNHNERKKVIRLPNKEVAA